MRDAREFVAAKPITRTGNSSVSSADLGADMSRLGAVANTIITATPVALDLGRQRSTLLPMHYPSRTLCRLRPEAT
jgi:hypothetical protein